MTISELLGTEDEEAQIAIVNDLLELERNPAYGMFIRYDLPKDGVEINIVGQVPFDFLYRMLELANKAVRMEEIETIKKLPKEE